jgi:hypothetical protein
LKKKLSGDYSEHVANVEELSIGAYSFSPWPAEVQIRGLFKSHKFCNQVLHNNFGEKSMDEVNGHHFENLYEYESFVRTYNYLSRCPFCKRHLIINLLQQV